MNFASTTAFTYSRSSTVIYASCLCGYKCSNRSGFFSVFFSGLISLLGGFYGLFYFSTSLIVFAFFGRLAVFFASSFSYSTVLS
jgi:hypothetical protein